MSRYVRVWLVVAVTVGLGVVGGIGAAWLDDHHPLVLRIVGAVVAVSVLAYGVCVFMDIDRDLNGDRP